MNKSDKKDKLAKIIGIIIGVAIVLGISYALFTLTLVGKKKTRITTGTLDLQLIENDETNPIKYTQIDLENAVPMTNAEGLSTIPYVFTLTNVGNIDASYTLSIEVANNSDLSAEYIKFALERINSNSQFESSPLLLSSVNTHTAKGSNNEDVILYDIDEGSINVNDSIDYRLRVWVDYNAQIGASNKSFEAVVRVSGVQKNK